MADSQKDAIKRSATAPAAAAAGKNNWSSEMIDSLSKFEKEVRVEDTSVVEWAFSLNMAGEQQQTNSRDKHAIAVAMSMRFAPSNGHRSDWVSCLMCSTTPYI
jgi:hypothetical protein